MTLGVKYTCPYCDTQNTTKSLSQYPLCDACHQLVTVDPPSCFIKATPSEGKLFYIPYWYFRGYLLTWKSDKIEKTWIDQSILAANIPHIPLTLNQNSPKLQLHIPTLKEKGYFFRPEIEQNQALSKIQKIKHTSIMIETFKQSVPNKIIKKKWQESFLKNLSKKRKTLPAIPNESALLKKLNQFDLQSYFSEIKESPPDEKDYITELFTLIYYPYYIQKNQIHDGIHGSRLETDPISYEKFTQYSENQVIKQQKIETVCHSCHSTLKISSNQFFFCSKCQKYYIIFKGKLAPINVQIHRSNEEKAFYFPFWKISVSVKGFLQKTNSQKGKPVVTTSEKENEFIITVWVPAFFILAHHFTRIANHLNINPANFQWTTIKDKDILQPITLALEESVKLLHPLIVEMTERHNQPITDLKKIRTKPQKAILLYLPFIKEGLDFIQRNTNISLGLYTLPDAIHEG